MRDNASTLEKLLEANQSGLADCLEWQISSGYTESCKPVFYTARGNAADDHSWSITVRSSTGQVPCKQLVRSYANEWSGQCNYPSVMKARQNGVPMAKMYEASVTDDSYTSRVFKMLIDGAYKESAYSSPEYKEKAIVNFRDTIFQACLQQQEQKG